MGPGRPAGKRSGGQLHRNGGTPSPKLVAMAALEDASRLLDWVSIHVFFTEYANAVDSRNWE